MNKKKKKLSVPLVNGILLITLAVVMIYGAAMLLEGALYGVITKNRILSYGIMVLTAILLRVFFDRQAAYASYKASVDVKQILREKIYGKLLKLGAAYRESVATSAVVQMAAEGVEQLETYFGRYLSQLFYSLLAPVTLFCILALINLKASVVLLICVPLIPISIVAVQKFAKKLLHKYWGIYTELGDTLSGGEKQRIGIARAFLHDAPFLLMDEPTSNLDALNEGVILKSLKTFREDKTVLLVSHRKSTMNLADKVYEMENTHIWIK